MIRGLVAVDRVQSNGPFEPIARPRVMDRFARAFDYPIVAVLAPAGFGKSVALRQYLGAQRVVHLRCDVGKEDATLAGFVRSLVDALAPAIPSAAQSFANAYEKALKAKDTPSALAGWLYAFLREAHGPIVIEDAHALAGDPAALAFLAALIERSRAHLQWIVVSRHQLDLPFATWLAYGYMDLPIDDIDLRLTFEEASYAANARSIVMRPNDLHELLALIDGWPAAFAFALRASTRTADFRRVSSGTREMVYQFLAEQVFADLDAGAREFLLATCLLPSLQPRELERNGHPNAAEAIEYLRRRTSFVVADGETSFRYHELFRDFLEHRLRTQDADGYRRALDASAALLHEAGNAREALRLHVRAGAREHVLACLERDGFDLLARADVDVVSDALASLSEEVRASSPIALGLRAALESIAGRFEAADTLFARATERAGCSSLGLELTRRHAQQSVGRLRFRHALELLQGIDPRAITDPSARATMLGTLAVASAVTGDAAAAREAAGEALVLASVLDDVATVANAHHVAGFVAFYAGDRARAHKFASRAVQLSESAGLHAIAARACSVLASCYDAEEDAQNAYWVSHRMRGFAEHAGDRSLAFSAQTNMYAIDAIRGNEERLRESESRIAAFEGDEHARATGVLASSYALQATWHGDFVAAHAMLAGSAGEQSQASRRAARWSEIALYAAAAGERESAEAALRCFALEDEAVEASDEAPRFTRGRLGTALAALVMGKSATAHRILGSLEASAAAGTPVLRSLLLATRALYVHLETGVAHRELEQALAQLRSAGGGGYAALIERLPLPESPASGGFAALTKAELAVLRSLARGGTSKSIALTLGRSPQTVDTHVKSIVKKFGCRRRHEAVARAVEAGLV